MENSYQYKELRDKFYKLGTEYASVYKKVKTSKDWKNPFRNIIAKDIPSLLKTCLNIQPEYKVIGSYGKGCWTEVPWIAIFDSRITTSAQKGVYIVYLINKDTKDIYLSFSIAATEVIGTKTDAEGKSVFYGVVGKNDPKLREKLRELAAQIRKNIPDSYFSSDEEIKTGAEGYDFGAVYYKKYSAEHLPDGNILIDDLKRMLDIYSRYYDWTNKKQDHHEPVINPEPEGDKRVPMSINETITQIKEYIESKGFSYDDDLIENFYLSLKSKPFVILAGTSGTGKTRLVKLFAEAMGAEYRLVSVRPDWSDGSDLFGHTDLNGKFVPGPVCSAFDAANEKQDRPVFLCLDEMNLARVEYYLSDFLSVIETREKQNGHIVTQPIAQYNGGIPENLYVIGTVNMDETTFPFSKKVLDRANTIEFNFVSLMPKQISGENPAALKLPNSFLRTEYLVLAPDCAEDMDFVEKVCAELQGINNILEKAKAHVGYRVRDEIVFYMLNNEKADRLLSYEQAMDNEIMQKILPRIQGSSAAIKNLLTEMYKFCMGRVTDVDSDTVNVSKKTKEDFKSAKYPKSAEKVAYMMTRFEDDGFTSYWL